MSYALCIWDPTRHTPLPTSAGEALEIVERLGSMPDGRNPTLGAFASTLIQRYEAKPSEGELPGAEAFWGADLRKETSECRSAVYRLELPTESLEQLVFVVEAGARHGLAVFDDEMGMCFLPDGTVFPEDAREMWASNLAELRAGPPDPNAVTPDSRTLLQKVAGELFDAIGRGNKRMF